MVWSNMKRYRLYLYGGGGAASITVGAFLLYAYASIVKTIVFEQLKMTDGSNTFILWRDTPVPQQMNFYFYNWTNPEGITNGTEKPKLKQMGPYSFKVVERKTNITWNENGTVTFQIQRFWFYDQANTKGSLDDEVTTLNSVAMSAANTLRDKDLFLKKGLSTSMWATRQKVHVTKKIGDILFFGYEDPLIEMARDMPAFAGIEIPPFDKFAWFYKRNGSSDFEGIFEMDTGVNDIFSFGKLRHWNYGNRTKFYPPPCGLVNGSAGELFPPERTRTKIEMFSADLCRSVALSYSEDVEVRGVKGYKYIGDKYTFDNGSLDPGNECFCGGECSPSGVLNVTACRYGAPGFISFPHYYLADSYYHEQVEGVEPKQQDHQLYITLEPNTGIPLDVAARFQINILLSQVNDIALFENVPKIYFPVMWFEQKATITEELAAQVRLALYLPLIIQCFGAFMVFIGVVMLGTTLYLIIRPHKRDNMQDIKDTEGTIEPLMDMGNNKPRISPILTKIT